MRVAFYTLGCKLNQVETESLTDCFKKAGFQLVTPDDGADIYRIMQLGASGVQMGTRFVATEECDASIKYKEAYINSKKEDICIINSPVGMLGRAIKNDFLRKIEEGHKQKFKCPCKCLKSCNFSTAPYCIALALVNAKKGNLDEGFAFAGYNAYKINKIVSVKELCKSLFWRSSRWEQ